MYRKLVAVLIMLALPAFALASDYSNVAINGQVLTWQELAALEIQIGGRIAPGNYLVDEVSGCWANLFTGDSGCPDAQPNGSVDVDSRYGSGSYDSEGNWNHYSNAAGGAVGGTSDGCVYTTFGWSNC